ncbi:MAG: sigma factor [Daejeonella sp.]
MSSPSNNKSTLADETLIASFQNGSQQAFAELYDKYAPALLGAISRIIIDREKAEEILQQTFSLIWKKKELYSPAKERFFTWIIKIARSACSESATLGGEIKCSEIREAINLVYARDIKNYLLEKQKKGGKEFELLMKKKHFRALELIYFKDFTFDAAANKLEIPLSEFRVELVSAIKELKTTLVA